MPAKNTKICTTRTFLTIWYCCIKLYQGHKCWQLTTQAVSPMAFWSPLNSEGRGWARTPPNLTSSEHSNLHNISKVNYDTSVGHYWEYTVDWDPRTQTQGPGMNCWMIHYTIDFFKWLFIVTQCWINAVLKRFLEVAVCLSHSTNLHHILLMVVVVSLRGCVSRAWLGVQLTSRLRKYI